MILLLLALGCGGDDPALAPWAEAAAALDAADAARAAGDADAELAQLERARGAVDLPDLAARHARRVLARDGIPAALAVLDGAIRRFPEAAGLRWDRAALRARGGDLGGAADDLRGPVSRGALDPRALGADPDLAPFAADPRLAELVRPVPVLARVVAGAPDGLLGEPWTLELEVRGPPGPARVRSAGRPPADLGSIVEDQLLDDGLEQLVRLRWSGPLRVAGEHPVGPWRVELGAREGEAPGFTVRVPSIGAAPGAGLAWPEALPVPSAVLGGAEPPAAVRWGEWVLVAVPAHLELQLDGAAAAGPRVRVELRSAGQPRWTGALVPAGPGGRWSAREPGGAVRAEGPL